MCGSVVNKLFQQWNDNLFRDRKLLLQALPTLLRYCNVRHSVKVRAWVREARETTVRTMQVFCVE